MSNLIEIAAGDWFLQLAPTLGGAITALRYRGEDVLRPASPDAVHPLQTSCFPMVPFVGRIAHGRFVFRGRRVTITPNLTGDAHVLHGFAWLEPWRVTDTRPESVTLTWQCQDRDDWPWAHSAEQRFTLDAAGLSIVLTVTNLSNRPMPGGIGLHPYFKAESGTRIRFAARQLWSSDAAILPDAPMAVDTFGDWAGGAKIPTTRDIDNSYEDWDGIADIIGAQQLRLDARGVRDLHLYAPAAADFFCLEPCSHLPDAFNRGDRFDVLDPGASRTIGLSIAWASVNRSAPLKVPGS